MAFEEWAVRSTVRATILAVLWDMCPPWLKTIISFMLWMLFIFFILPILYIFFFKSGIPGVFAHAIWYDIICNIAYVISIPFRVVFGLSM